MKKHTNEINYIYFAASLFFLIVLSFVHIFSTDTELFGIQIFYLLYCIGQALLEIAAVILVGFWIKYVFPRFVYKIYIGLFFLLLLGHFANFTILRIWDASLGFAVKILFAAGINHFATTIRAMNMNFTMICLILACVTAIPLIGILFYWLTHKLSLKKPMRVSQSQIITGLLTLCLFLFILDFSAQPILKPDHYSKLHKSLPLGKTFLTPSGQALFLDAPLREPHEEEDLIKGIEKKVTALDTKPNIFLFVIETLRKDYIQQDTAPHLEQFYRENVSSTLSLSNANATQLSWFSIFFSHFPYHWNAVRQTWKSGSPQLQILKKMGYNIRVYSSAELNYFEMQNLIFGENHSICEKYAEYYSLFARASKRDELAIQALLDDLANPSLKEGNVFIIFLDSTHSEYDWPEDFPAAFLPISEEIDYLSISQSRKSLDLIKNRYRNAVRYVDSLFGKVRKELDLRDLWKDAIIIATGDHGEEFFENGALFHGTHLNKYQTTVPIYYKFPQLPEDWKVASLSSHIDIFPTILHYLTRSTKYQCFSDGCSLFDEYKWPFAISVQQNGAYPPSKFFLHNGMYKLTARFNSPLDIYKATQLEILSIKSSEDDFVDGKNTREDVEKFIDKNFQKGINALLKTMN